MTWGNRMLLCKMRSCLRRWLSSSSSVIGERILVPRSRISAPYKPRRLRRDPPVKRPSENDSASLSSWDNAVNIIKRGSTHGGFSLSGGLRIALLIDAENITYKNVDGIMNEVEKLGIVQIRRIYADWTSEIMRGWRQTVLTNALTPIHQFQSSSGKGNTDSMMIIDAMDILFKNKDIESFCIVSSDADFTRLATKLREEGKLVLGIGSNLTPAPFVVACNRFVYLHNLMKEDVPQPVVQTQPQTSRPAPIQAPQPSAKVSALAKPAAPPTQTAAPPVVQMTPAKTKAKIDLTGQRDVVAKANVRSTEGKATQSSESLKAFLPVLTRAWVSYRMDNGWAPIVGVATELQRIHPDFSVEAFGPYSKFEDMLEATDAFEVKRQKSAPSATLVRRIMLKNSIPGINSSAGEGL